MSFTKYKNVLGLLMFMLVALIAAQCGGPAPETAPAEPKEEVPIQAPPEAPIQAPTQAPTQPPTEAPIQIPATEEGKINVAFVFVGPIGDGGGLPDRNGPGGAIGTLVG